MTELTTGIVCIIDKSGSMTHLTDETLSGYNDFLSEQKEIEGEATLTLSLFNDEVDVVYESEPIDEVSELSEDDYKPSGFTALHDAVGVTLDNAEERIDSMDDEPDNMIVLIITDGLENSSGEYDGSDVKKIVNDKKEEGWEFIFMGAAEDVISQASSLGVDSTDVSKFAPTKGSTRALYKSASSSISRYRKTGEKGDIASNISGEPSDEE